MAHPRKVDATRSRLLAKLVREILATPDGRQVATLAELVEMIKRRCAHLRIGWTADDIAEALRIIVSNCPLPGARVVQAARPLPTRRTVTRADASAFLQRLGVRL